MSKAPAPVIDLDRSESWFKAYEQKRTELRREIQMGHAALTMVMRAGGPEKMQAALNHKLGQCFVYDELLGERTKTPVEPEPAKEAQEAPNA